MNRTNVLTESMIKKTRPQDKVFKLCDGQRLYLYILPSGQKTFRILWREKGAQKQYTVGTFPSTSLAQAREERDRVNALIKQGVDPNRERAKQGEGYGGLTFQMVAEEWHAHQTENLVPSYRKQKMQRMVKHVFPIFGDRTITSITFRELVAVMREMKERNIPEMTRRIAQSINEVFLYALLMEYVENNVAANLTRILFLGHEVQHRAAITDPVRIGKLLRDIDTYQGSLSVQYALKILPYVFLRSREVRMATWNEIDFEKALWTVPATHMKKKRSHMVPLSRQVLRFFEELRALRPDSDLIFASAYAKERFISDSALLHSLRRMGYSKEEMCVHGFRGMASTRLNEMGFRSDVIEAQLAHVQENKVRAAYNHAIYLEERAEMMQQWADYLDSLKASVPEEESAPTEESAQSEPESAHPQEACLRTEEPLPPKTWSAHPQEACQHSEEDPTFKEERAVSEESQLAQNEPVVPDGQEEACT